MLSSYPLRYVYVLTEPSMQKRLIQITPLIRRHTSILSCLTVKDQVNSQQRTTKDGTSIHQPLRQVTLCQWGLRCLCLIPPPALLERITEDTLLLRDGRDLLEGVLLDGLLGGSLEGSEDGSGCGLLEFAGEGRGDGEGSAHEERHC